MWLQGNFIIAANVTNENNQLLLCAKGEIEVNDEWRRRSKTRRVYIAPYIYTVDDQRYELGYFGLYVEFFLPSQIAFV